MKLFRSEYPSIDAADPWMADKLGRKKVGDMLTPIVASISQPFVIAIESPYGSGKSVFLDCWRTQLEGLGIKAIKFDAWKSDFSQDALAAFMACLNREMPKGKGKAFAKGTIDAGKKIMKATATKVPGVVLKAVIHHVLGAGAAKDLTDSLSIDASDLADLGQQVVDEALELQARAEAGLVEFRTSLSKWVETLPRAADTNVRMVVLVDELDRCRPTYAIQILECIKHLFGVPGLVFVLAVDWQVLCGAIAGTYGDRIDADGYLRKFIDWRYRLPEPKPAMFAQHLKEKFNLGDLRNIFAKLDNDTIDTAISVFAVVVGALGLTLREQEQTFTQFNLTVRTATARQSPHVIETAFLVAYCSRYRDQIETFLATNTASDYAARQIVEKMRGAVLFGKQDRDLAIFQAWFINEKEHDRLERQMGSAPPGHEEKSVLMQALEVARHHIYNMGGRKSIAETVIHRMRLSWPD